HLNEYRVLYLLVIIFFLLGIIAGTVSVHFLEPEQNARLASYLDSILAQFDSTAASIDQAFYQVFSSAFKEIGLIWFLGLTVLGMPLIITFIFLKGFILGFTVGLLVLEKAFSGIAFSLLAILPPNLIHIPVIIIAAVLGLAFSLNLLRGQRYGGGLTGLISYSGLMVLVMLVIMAGGLIEIYLSPVFARVVLNYF
ncbi:MAG: stage II sporulation protein M, partial [Clostridia bacterium]|nr:stage II sporulation protein M [Clostridia bacterium]